MRLARHQRAAIPALLESAFDQFTTHAMPSPLRNILQVVKQLSRPLFLRRVSDPDFWQALIRWQIADSASQKRALQTGDDTFAVECVRPQCGDGEIRGLGEAMHAFVSIAEPGTVPRHPRRPRPCGDGGRGLTHGAANLP